MTSDTKGSNPTGSSAPMEELADPRRVDPERWVDEHGDAMFRYAMLQVRDRHAAEDLVQESLLAALQSGGTFQGRSAERTWLIGILRHKIIDHLRRQGRQASSVELEAADPVVDGVFDKKGRWASRPVEWKDDPAALLERAEFRKILLDCIHALPRALAEAFSLRVMEEAEPGDVCKVLEITSTNLWVMLHRARSRLRQCLEARWFRRSPADAQL